MIFEKKNHQKKSEKMNFSFFNKNTLIFPLKLGPPNNKLSKIIKIRQKKSLKKVGKMNFYFFNKKYTDIPYKISRLHKISSKIIKIRFSFFFHDLFLSIFDDLLLGGAILIRNISVFFVKKIIFSHFFC